MTGVRDVFVICGLCILGFAACTLEDDSGEDEGTENTKVALVFVGHGEPAAAEDGEVPITFADGTPFGPHAVSLGVPEEHQFTEWAAAYEEIATAMTYIFPDVNENGTPHEIEISPLGDVPPFFTWEAFHESVFDHYGACDNFSPHNDALAEHINSLTIGVEGADVDTYLAFLDAVPRIPDVVYEIANGKQHDKLVLIPLLLASSTHTQEVEHMVEEVTHLTEDLEVLVGEPYFEIPFMRNRVKDAVLSMVDYLQESVPADAAAADIAVLLASHGTPYVPPFEEFGWQEGEIFSNLIITETAFHEEISEALPFSSRTGRMNYADPTIEDSLDLFDSDGYSHVLVVPSVFPTTAIHTMWDVANSAVERAVLPSEGVIVHERPSGMKIYYSAEGYADIEPGRSQFRAGLNFVGKVTVLEAIEPAPSQ